MNPANLSFDCGHNMVLPVIPLQLRKVREYDGTEHDVEILSEGYDWFIAKPVAIEASDNLLEVRITRDHVYPKVEPRDYTQPDPGTVVRANMLMCSIAKDKTGTAFVVSFYPTKSYVFTETMLEAVLRICRWLPKFQQVKDNQFNYYPK